MSRNRMSSGKRKGLKKKLPLNMLNIDYRTKA